MSHKEKTSSILIKKPAFYQGIGFRIFLIFLFPILACVTSAYFIGETLEKYRESNEQIRQFRSSFSISTTLLNSRLGQAENFVLGYLINKDAQTREQFQKHWSLISNDITKIQQMSASYAGRPRMQKNLEQLKIDTQTFATKAGQAFALSPNGIGTEISTLRMTLNDTVLKIQAEIDIIESEMIENQESIFDRNQKRTVMILAAMLLFAGVLTFFVSFRLISYINEVGSRCQEIAEGYGDLSRRFNLSSNDEIGILTHNFDRFLDRTYGLISQTVNSAREVTRSVISIMDYSNKFSNSTQQLRKNSALEQLAMDRARLAFSKLDDGIRNGQNNMKSAGELIIKGQDQASLSAQQVRMAMDEIRVVLENTKGITNHIDSISKIAKETKILSINASIEASKTGLQNHGFLALADQILSLSDDVAKITNELMSKMAESSAQINKGSEMVRVAESSIEDFKNTVLNCNQQVKELLASSDSHNMFLQEAMEQIGALTTTIDSNAQSATSVASYASALGKETESLKSEIQSLSDALSRFQLPDNETVVVQSGEGNSGANNESLAA